MSLCNYNLNYSIKKVIVKLTFIVQELTSHLKNYARRR